ncbi:hypothetical protein Gogos_016379 [Gossypium gossypioides]|uniref:Uncharacterized protein n=1 Tax=Gossypium gossypioides TaxID=34282 RepID=A0A7J9B7J0_GOSGO|nr:hypothetical protein [Gossypium gossypioides]
MTTRRQRSDEEACDVAVTRPLKAGFGWQLGDCKKAKIGLDRWGFEGLDGNSLKDPSSGSRERVVCEFGEEITIYALKECLKACAILTLGGIDRCLLANEYERCIDWLEEATRLLDKKAFKDRISILWNIWNNRNNAIFRCKDEDARIVWDRAKV